ncbi:MAG TPA: glycosyltransferase family 9 protein [candidate division Zixibacteria bacterium]
MKRITLKGDEKILIVRTDGMGDVILSIPTLELIKSNYPDCHLAMLVSPYTVPLLENNPYLDEVLTDDKNDKHKGIRGFLVLAGLLRDRKFDIAVALHPSWRVAILLILARIKYRVGTGYRFYSFFFNLKLFQHRKDIQKHELEYNLDMLGPLSINPEKILPKVYLSTQEKEKGNVLLEKLGIKSDNLLVVVHAGSRNSSLNFPPEKFAQVADELVEKEGVNVVLTGSIGESSLVKSAKNRMKQNSINLVGKLGLRELAILLKRADLMIANSTGPMHLAVAIGTPVVAIFCPIFVASPKRWGPYGENNQVVLPPVPICQKCKPKRCRYYNCMDKVDTEEVYLKAKSLLNWKKKLEEKG